MAYATIAEQLVPTTPPAFFRKAPPKQLRHLLTARALDADDVDELCRNAAAHESWRGIRWTDAPARRSRCCSFSRAPAREWVSKRRRSRSARIRSASRTCRPRARTRAPAESLEDCAAVVSRLCDALVVRHHEVGAAERMAAKSQRPVINAGDGWNEHPTQALIDIFAMRRGLGTIAGKSIAFGGDPRGRTVRSLAAAAAVRSAEGDRVLPAAACRGAGGRAVGVHRAPDPHSNDLGHRARAERMRRHHDGALRHVGHRRACGVRLRLAEGDARKPRHHAGENRAIALAHAALSSAAAAGRD